MSTTLGASPGSTGLPTSGKLDAIDLAVDTASLARGLRVVERAVSGRAARALPILNNLLLTAGDGRLTLTASDGSCAIKAACLAKVRTPGRVALPARLLAEYADRLAAEQVMIILDPARGRVRVAAGRASATIAAVDPDTFPALPDPPLDRAVTIDTAGLRRALGRVAPFAAEDDARPVLGAIRCRIDDRGLTAAAADGHRAARARCAILAGAADTGGELLIPARAIGQLARLLRDDTPTYLMTMTGRNGCWFVHGAVALYSQLIDGAFPDVDQLIPAGASTTCTVDTGTLAQALRQAGLFDETATARSVLLQATAGTLTVFAGGDDAGEGLSEIDAEVNGVGGIVVLDTGYLKDLLDGSPPARLALAWEGEYTAIAVRDADRHLDEIAAADVWVLMPQYGQDVLARFDRARREAVAGARSIAA